MKESNAYIIEKPSIDVLQLVAVAYYRYCAEYGGETGIRKSAIERLDNIK